MNNFWKGFEKTSKVKWHPTRLLDKLRLGEKTKRKGFSIKGWSGLKDSKK